MELLIQVRQGLWSAALLRWGNPVEVEAVEGEYPSNTAAGEAARYAITHTRRTECAGAEYRADTNPL